MSWLGYIPLISSNYSPWIGGNWRTQLSLVYVPHEKFLLFTFLLVLSITLHGPFLNYFTNSLLYVSHSTTIWIDSLIIPQFFININTSVLNFLLVHTPILWSFQYITCCKYIGSKLSFFGLHEGYAEIVVVLISLFPSILNQDNLPNHVLTLTTL